MHPVILTSMVMRQDGLWRKRESRLLISSVQRRDYAVVQFGVLITAAIVVTSNLLVDIAYSVIDPRIRSEA